MFLIPAILAIAYQTAPAIPVTHLDPDNGVYSAVIDRFYLSPQVKQLVVREETDERTAHGRAQEELARVLAALPESAFQYEDFRARNARPAEIRPGFDLPVQVSLVSTDGLLAFGGGTAAEYWERFRTRYPGSPGYLIFSRPGYSSNQHRALVYVYHGCGPRCSEARYVLLRKDVGGWSVVGSVVVE
jgi:hypothetical protein